MEKKIPPGDDHERFVCPKCDYIHYLNPINIVSVIAVYDGKVLLCRRAIEPREGFWTIPSGHQECGETTRQGAVRETLEEAGADIQTEKPYIYFDLGFYDQSHIVFLSQMLSDKLSPGEESYECRLFSESEIPWDSLAFKTDKEALKTYFKDRASGRYPFHYVEFEEPNRAPDK